MNTTRFASAGVRGFAGSWLRVKGGRSSRGHSRYALLPAGAAVLVCTGALAYAQGSATASPEARSRLYVTAAASSLVDQGLALPAPAGTEAAAFEHVPHPGVRVVPNVARATNVPWIDSNGWRFQRGLRKAHYAQLPQGSAPLAAAEAYTFNVDAILDPDPVDVEPLGRMLRFLNAQDQPLLPAMANIGVVDSPSPLMSEILNLLTRRNLLYRVVSAPDPSLDLTIQLGTADFPAESAVNPHDFAARVRARLGDDKRLVRLYGTTTVVARLTGDRRRARLHLLSFSGSRRQQQGRNPQAIRVRVLGHYTPARLAAYGADEHATLTDLRNPEGSTEFWVPDFSTLAIIDLEEAR